MIARPFFRGPSLELLTTEGIYFLIVLVLCYLIYSKTKEVYALTQHEGVFHFRNIFLYFVIAYFFRLVHVLFIFWHSTTHYGRPGFVLFPLHHLSLVLVGYFSTLAILSLGMTVLVRYMDRARNLPHYALHLFALLTFVFVAFTRSPGTLFLLQGIIFIATLIVLFRSSLYEKKKSSFLSHNKITYLLLFVVWILHVLVLSRHLIPRFFKIPLYFISVCVFFSIYFRVHKRLTFHGKKKRSY